MKTTRSDVQHLTIVGDRQSGKSKMLVDVVGDSWVGASRIFRACTR